MINLFTSRYFFTYDCVHVLYYCRKVFPLFVLIPPTLSKDIKSFVSSTLDQVYKKIG